MDSWKEIGEKRKKDIYNKIKPEWRLDESILKKYDENSTESMIEVPEQCGLLTPKEIEITRINNVNELSDKILQKIYSCVEVTTAFCKRAAIAHQLVNCLTEIFFEEAITKAKELDAYLEKNGKPIGTLHGIPISLKDQFRVPGTQTSMGYVAWVDIIDDHYSVMTEILKDQGAVFYCKTSVPQTLMLGETKNHIIGLTVSPFGKHLTCGGSSGGEGALIGLRGSILGIGSDIGGSIRIPTSFNGLYALKPSHGRLPYSGAKNSFEGQESVHSVFGPIGRSTDSLVTFVKSVLIGQPWYHDPKVVELNWRDDMYSISENPKLCFGVILNDGNVHPTPPVQRALEELIAKVKKAGHSVIEMKPPRSHQEGIKVLLKMYTADGGKEVREVVSKYNEPLLPEALYGNEKSELTVLDLWKNNNLRTEYAKEYMEYWNSTAKLTGTDRPIDGIICPVTPHPAVPHGKFPDYGYTLIWNLLDYSTGVFPVTTADQEKDQWKPDQNNFFNDIDKEVHHNYDPKVSHNLPVCLQIACRRQQEEKVLGLMKVLDNINKQL